MTIQSILKLALQTLFERKENYTENDYNKQKDVFLSAAKRCEQDSYEEYKDKL